jgi:hypothetical protein
LWDPDKLEDSNKRKATFGGMKNYLFQKVLLNTLKNLVMSKLKLNVFALMRLTLEKPADSIVLIAVDCRFEPVVAVQPV